MSNLEYGKKLAKALIRSEALPRGTIQISIDKTYDFGVKGLQGQFQAHISHVPIGEEIVEVVYISHQAHNGFLGLSDPNKIQQGKREYRVTDPKGQCNDRFYDRDEKTREITAIYLQEDDVFKYITSREEIKKFPGYWEYSSPGSKSL